jgi:uncharacterized phosphosugar-binding protein
MKPYEIYTGKIISTLTLALENQKEKIEKIAEEFARRIETGGVIHLFGTGHSHMIAEEAFFRAGGLACVNAILEPNLMLHNGAEQSGWLEQVEGFAAVILEKNRVSKHDVMIVISNSGRNAVPIEMGMEARKRGLFTVSLTSLNYRNEPSRHSSGKKLFAVTDEVLDNYSEIGDAVLEMENGIRMGPTSTIIGASLVNVLMVQTAAELKKRKVVLPIIQSANVDTQGVTERNKALIGRYRTRVRLF